MHDQRMVELLLKHSADPNLPAANDITPLHRTAMRGQATIAVQLLAAGAEAARRDALGRTPLDWALLEAWPTVAEALGGGMGSSTHAALPLLDGGLLETIKVVDVLTPLPRGGTIRTTARGGVGKRVLLAELEERLSRRGGRAVYVRWQERFYRTEDASREQMEPLSTR